MGTYAKTTVTRITVSLSKFRREFRLRSIFFASGILCQSKSITDASNSGDVMNTFWNSIYLHFHSPQVPERETAHAGRFADVCWRVAGLARRRARKTSSSGTTQQRRDSGSDEIVTWLFLNLHVESLHLTLQRPRIFDKNYSRLPPKLRQFRDQFLPKSIDSKFNAFSSGGSPKHFVQTHVALTVLNRKYFFQFLHSFCTI